MEWHDIRSNWVNGNRRDAKDDLYNLPKMKLIKIVLDCLMDAHTLEYQSGDITDLIEILKGVIKESKM